MFPQVVDVPRAWRNTLHGFSAALAGVCIDMSRQRPENTLALVTSRVYAKYAGYITQEEHAMPRCNRQGLHWQQK
jgi:hypothetical protein